MAIERSSGASSLVDVLDHILDKGIVIDAWVCVSLVGINLITVEARIIVASVETYLKYAEAVGRVAAVAKPVLAGKSPEALAAENRELRAALAGRAEETVVSSVKRRKVAAKLTSSAA